MSDQNQSTGQPPEADTDFATLQQKLQTERDRLELLQQVSAAANQSGSIEEAFRIGLDLVCEYTKWPLAHVFLPQVEADGTVVLASSGIWFCDDCDDNDTFTFFQQVTTEMTFASGEGWLGRVFADKKPTWLTHVLASDDFLRNHRLQDLNVRAGFAFPVLVGDEVVALMEFYATESMAPDEELLHIMAHIGTQLGRVVEREKAAQQIARSRNFYLRLFENFPYLIWQSDEAGRCNFVNRQWQAFTGRDMEEGLGDGWMESIHATDRERCQKTWQTAVAERQPFTTEYRLRRHDGVYRWMRDHGQPYQDMDGAYSGFIGVCVDVTRFVETETALRRQTMMLNEAQEVARLGSWELDPATQQVTATDHLYDLVGIDRETWTLSSQNLLNLIHPEDREAATAQLEAGLRQTDPWDTYQRIVRPDGAVRHLHIRNKPVLDDRGRVRRVVGVAQDVTERMKAARQIRKQVQRLSFLQEVGQTVVSTLDLDEVLNRTLETLRPLLNAEGVFVLLGDGHKMHFAAADHVGPGDITGVSVSVDRGVAGDAIRSGRPQWISGDEAKERVFSQIEEIADYVTRSIIAIPLQVQHRTIGVVEAVHSEDNAFVSDDVQMLAAAASWIAIAIENARLYGEIREEQRRFRELSEDLVWAQEEERRRISRDLHDGAGQNLAALEIQFDLMESKVESDAIRRDLRSARELFGTLMQQLRSLAYNLRPPELDTIGLTAALVDLCKMVEKQTDLPIHFSGETISRQVPDAILLSFYRFLQEALTNVVKHAQATKVEVELTCNGEIRLNVSDNGRGIQQPQKGADLGSGLGLLGMRERFAALNGSVHISSQPGKGTEVTAVVPW